MSTRPSSGEWQQWVRPETYVESRNIKFTEVEQQQLVDSAVLRTIYRLERKLPLCFNDPLYEAAVRNFKPSEGTERRSFAYAEQFTDYLREIFTRDLRACGSEDPSYFEWEMNKKTIIAQAKNVVTFISKSPQNDLYLSHVINLLGNLPYKNQFPLSRGNEGRGGRG